MLEILTHRDHKEAVSFDLCFYTSPGAGYTFPCDEEGRVDEAKLNPAALTNYRRCIAGEFGDGQVERRDSVETIMATGKCSCSRVLTLSGDQACPCGRLYNSAGQELTRLGYQDLPGEDY